LLWSTRHVETHANIKNFPLFILEGQLGSFHEKYPREKIFNR
jgi:hypothetical protein